MVIRIPVRPFLRLGLVDLVDQSVRGDLWVRLGQQDHARQGSPTKAKRKRLYAEQQRDAEYHIESADSGESEAANAVNITHSGTRWAVRTLISFQTMGSLQWRIKNKASDKQCIYVVGGKHIFLLGHRLSVIKQAQREAKKTSGRKQAPPVGQAIY